MFIDTSRYEMEKSPRVRRLITAFALVAFGAVSPSSLVAHTRTVGQVPTASKNQAVPRTAWGDPDLQGTYTNSNESGIPMQRPAEFAGKQLNEVTPAEMARLIQQRREQTQRTAVVIGGTSDNDTGAGPSHWYENYNASNSRAWMILSYMGDPRGHWEGDTLVVETTNFLQKSAYGGASSHLKTVERSKPVRPGVIDWSITFDDAHTWVRPWTFGMQLTRDESQSVFEYACHEGNDGLQGILRAARVDERAAEQKQKPASGGSK